MQQNIKEQLLVSLRNEESNVTKRKLGDCAAELARKLVGMIFIKIMN